MNPGLDEASHSAGEAIVGTGPDWITLVESNTSPSHHYGCRVPQ